jgi:ABC-type nitrate/sulfonate/bicarbonate transport system permease component
MRRLAEGMQGVAAVMAALLLWEAAVRVLRVSPRLLPPPSAVGAAFAEHADLFLQHGVPTLAETFAGFGLAALCGFALGLALFGSVLVQRAVMPWILAAQIVPKIALAPLFVVWLGVGAPCRMAFAVFIAFFPVLVATVAGLSTTERGALGLCRALGAGPVQTLLRVRLPFAMPHLLAGLKTAATLALLGVVIGEFVTAQQGLGYLVLLAGNIDETALMLAAIGLLLGVGALLYAAILLLEWVFGRWYGAPMVVGEF